MSGHFGKLNAYVPATASSTIKTTGRVIGNRSLGSFSQYVPATSRSYITTTGPVESVPNETGGIHARISRAQVSGLGTIFGDGQTNWIEGVANEYIVAGLALVVLLGVMK
jgi:hypothetical protein